MTAQDTREVEDINYVRALSMTDRPGSEKWLNDQRRNPTMQSDDYTERHYGWTVDAGLNYLSRRSYEIDRTCDPSVAQAAEWAMISVDNETQRLFDKYGIKRK